MRFSMHFSTQFYLIRILSIIWIIQPASIAALVGSTLPQFNDMSLLVRRNYNYSQQRSALAFLERRPHLSTSLPKSFRGIGQLYSITNIPVTSKTEPNATPQDIAIVGGGLSGLSTAYHLLKHSIDHNIQAPSITVLDKTEPGKGGASSVAGGLLHPFSPRGKLIYQGKEGLHVSNTLIKVAQKYMPECVLREKLYRLALTEKNVKDLKQTASLYPDLATWLSLQDIENQCGSSTHCLGGVVLAHGCKVIHVPTYLQGLWKACQDLSNFTATWSLVDEGKQPTSESSNKFWKEQLKSFDCVIFSAGSGLFVNSILQQEAINFPIELVRGQSVEMTLDDDDILAQPNFSNEALLCGKYIAPQMGNNKVLIGATHEYKQEPLDNNDVMEELRSRSYDISHFIWEKGHVDKITTGYRVQSRRGKYGRMPIIGKTMYDDIHHNSWIFTGLSARGLIYHGVFGKHLSKAILENNEDLILREIPEAFWWKEVN